MFDWREKIKKFPKSIRDSALEFLMSESKEATENTPERREIKPGAAVLAQQELNEIFKQPFNHMNGSNLYFRYDQRCVVQDSALHIKESIRRPTIEFDGVTTESNIKHIEAELRKHIEKGSKPQFTHGGTRMNFAVLGVQCDININANGSMFNDRILLRDIAETAQSGIIVDAQGNSAPVKLASPVMQVMVKMDVMNDRDDRHKSLFCARDIVIVVCASGRTIQNFISKNEDEINADLKKGYLDGLGVRTIEQFQNLLVGIFVKMIEHDKNDVLEKLCDIENSQLPQGLDRALLRCMREDPLLKPYKPVVKELILKTLERDAPKAVSKVRG